MRFADRLWGPPSKGCNLIGFPLLAVHALARLRHVTLSQRGGLKTEDRSGATMARLNQRSRVTSLAPRIRFCQDGATAPNLSASPGAPRENAIAPGETAAPPGWRSAPAVPWEKRPCRANSSGLVAARATARNPARARSARCSRLRLSSAARHCKAPATTLFQ